ncbi:MAG: hypothetical protein QF681_10015 [Vicinamibacterales bacterium]|jgi:hypothetical protein|nr:hypothetical protein [Acidobacteriota bacterium]MDP6371541.1 hypothetical protein [Vicinamibacterales bacterium]MQG59596.1 hypothetical protein [SAR202 cluster bacterium]MDP6580981.1 hypothetical protein [Vicinamibacterales bacterium]MQG67969.1 hypothetical protein [SAR202 cluster bacterium]|tara:strand:- start:20360 stop:20779 length:420 start_codon:yes stop_codon:yes gene_type:complete
MQRLGDLPAMFDEGVAVHVAERLGADALGSLGSPGMTADAALCRFLETGQLLSLRELAALSEIGSLQSRPEVAYPQSASIMGFLIDEFGMDRFRDTLRALAASVEPRPGRIPTVISEALQISMAQLERRWHDHISDLCN